MKYVSTKRNFHTLISNWDLPARMVSSKCKLFQRILVSLWGDLWSNGQISWHFFDNLKKFQRPKIWVLRSSITILSIPGISLSNSSYPGRRSIEPIPLRSVRNVFQKFMDDHFSVQRFPKVCERSFLYDCCVLVRNTVFSFSGTVTRSCCFYAFILWSD